MGGGSKEEEEADLVQYTFLPVPLGHLDQHQSVEKSQAEPGSPAKAGYTRKALLRKPEAGNTELPVLLGK